MFVCTFFGHRNCPDDIKYEIKKSIIDLIENQNVDLFLVGSEGNFDRMVQSILKQLVDQYQINYYVVLAYLPSAEKDPFLDYSHTIMPENFENVPPRFAIDHRNSYMLKRADYVITYITKSYGGAAKFAGKAIQQKKKVINIANFQ